MPKHLHIDPFSGIAGDMFLGALLDLGLPLDALRQALASLPIDDPFQISAKKVSRHGIGATDLQVRVPNQRHQPAPVSQTSSHHHKHKHHHHHHHEHTTDTAHDHSHTHRNYHDLMRLIEPLDTTERGKKRLAHVVTLLAEAEAHVHQTTLEHIHFHEVGAIDSIVDLFGVVIGLELLDIETLSCGYLPISRGFVRCDHGNMPVPAPATAILLTDIPTIGVDREGELVTPTGAALVKGLCQTFGPQPPMTTAHIGYGAGDRDDPNIPNLLRVFCGTRFEPGEHGPVVPEAGLAP